jgi:hypothetical protein
MKLIIIRQLNNFDPYIEAVVELPKDFNYHHQSEEEYLSAEADAIIREVKKTYPEFCSANFHKRYVDD